MADGSDGACTIDVAAVAAALGITKRSAERRAIHESWPFTEQPVRGGRRRLYALNTLPRDVQAAVFLAHRPALDAAATALHSAFDRPAVTRLSEAAIKAAWIRYEAVPQHLKDAAARRLKALQAVERLVAQGHRVMDARAVVAAQLQREGVRGGSVASLARWAADVAVAEKQHRLALLVPDYVGRTAAAPIPTEAWDLFKADYLRVEAPSATSCYERVQRIARVQGWTLPSLRTFERRIERELSPQLRTLARRGVEALDRMFPAQERDRSVFTALQAVNADGHKFDVFVRFPMGQIARPIMVGVQDLYSGKLLGWRIAETESADLARMAFRDVVERYGVMQHAWLDNGRGFASKMLTGGVANRFRFKVREEDPIGALVAMGVEIHWATPYHGQAKPIERAWRDLCDRIAKHPAFAGAYTGNKPDAKPENYGSKAVELEVFTRVVGEEIAAHNAREGRRTRVCMGRSFDAVFADSYARHPVRKATDEQLRQMLLAAEVVTADARDGSVKLSGNRYWCEALARHCGQKLLLRFDPDALHAAVQVYTLANAYLGSADCIAAVGFADTQAAKEHSRARKQHRRAARQQLDAERRMDAAQVAAQLPTPMPEPLPAAGVIAPIFGKARTAGPAAETLARTGTDDARESQFGDLMARLAARAAADAGFVPGSDA